MKNMTETTFTQDYEKRLSLFKDNFVVNWHEHVWEDSQSGKLRENSLDRLRKSAEATCTDAVICSIPLSKPCIPDDFSRVNRLQYEACQRWDKLYGLAFIHVGYTKEALYEIEKCVYDYGFVGIKLYHHYFIDDPQQFAVIEKCIELDIPILVHAGKSVQLRSTQPKLSAGHHFANIARLYPEANIIMAHIGGGGDWQWQIKAITDSPSIVTDISGSVVDAPMIEDAIKRLGARRILFGTDGSYEAGVGKILGANISEEDKKTILEGTAYRRFLNRRARK
ncbi:MAG TPA: amidohydrolase [Clostridiales bacterium]|jgi:hypothetical protein|nr:amidohydrolase [Clostridiales bacterium]HCG35725.1 amidohydrolase [Clostridiales bacterium]